ncbi:MAG: 8-amino-7-oxononanoate synthase [Deltaproteobacteria bacterium]|nr:8-amino-7-oxononanoate synthase [Deltaproteobacteria bacterium]
MFNQRIRDRLTLQKRTGLYRDPPVISKRRGKHVCLDGTLYLSFASNDYLGFADSPVFKDILVQNVKGFGTSSSSSRLVTGNYTLIREAEAACADYFGYETALFFPSGFQANLGLLSALFEAGDPVMVDQHIHASSVSGMALSGADVIGFRHGNLDHLEKKLKKNDASRTAVVTESLFSMDGDLLDVTKLARLKRDHGFLSIVDEAHSFGAIGPGGRGIAHGVADIAVGTFGKAFGLFGAFVLLPDIYKEYLLNFSAPLMFTTTLPPSHAGTVIDILKIMERAEREREQLAAVSQNMKSRLLQAGFRAFGDAHILGVEIGDEDLAVRVALGLKEHGILVFPARYPTVALNRAILRIGMTALHNEKDVKLFVGSLQKTLHKEVKNHA